MATKNLTRDKARRPIYKCRRCGKKKDGKWFDLDDYNKLMDGGLPHRLIDIHDCYVESEDGNDNDYTSGIADLIGFDRQTKASK